MSTAQKSTPVPHDVQDRVRASVEARQRAEQAARDADLAALTTRFARERSAIISPATDDRLREHAARIRVPEDAGIEDRRRRGAEQQRFAAEIGVDLGALARWRADFARQSEAITAAPHVVAENRMVDGAADAAAPTSPLTWNGYWDPGYTWHSTRPSDFAIWNAQTYFDQNAGRVGSKIKFRQRESGDNTRASMYWPNGYMVIFKMPRSGRVQVKVRMTCDFSHHFIDTDNEPGNSSCNVQAYQYVAAEIYNDWSDSTPVTATSGHVLASDATSDLEDWIEYSPIAPGTTRTVYLHSPPSLVLPVDFDFAIWVAEVNVANAVKLNDTRATVGVDASWVMKSISVRVI